MESMTSKSGFCSNTWRSMRSKSVSLSTYKLSSNAFKRSARMRIWRELSSPVTYKTLCFLATYAHMRKFKLDLPTPGSPTINTNEPGIMPPPNTRFISGEPAENLGKSSVSIVFIGFGIEFVLFVFKLKLRFILVKELGSSSSSTSVFHLPQPGHLPSHFGTL